MSNATKFVCVGVPDQFCHLCSRLCDKQHKYFGDCHCKNCTIKPVRYGNVAGVGNVALSGGCVHIRKANEAEPMEYE